MNFDLILAALIVYILLRVFAAGTVSHGAKPPPKNQGKRPPPTPPPPPKKYRR